MEDFSSSMNKLVHGSTVTMPISVPLLCVTLESKGAGEPTGASDLPTLEQTNVECSESAPSKLYYILKL